MELIVVNYHYIREEAEDKGIHAMSCQAFADQLDAIAAAGYTFISLDQLNDAIVCRDVSKLPEKACLITFDDGLKESYTYGLSILDAKGIPAVFFVIGKALDQQSVMTVHKLHYVRKFAHDRDILSDVTAIVDKNISMNDDVLRQQYPWDTVEAARVKYLLNFVLTESQRTEYVDAAFARVYRGSESDYAQELYMNPSQIRDLAERTYLGVHSYAHQVMADLSDEDLEKDFRKTAEALKRVAHVSVNTISYPYGGATAVNERVMRETEKQGFISAFTMQRGINTKDDIMNRSLTLKRLDTNDVIGGKSENIYKELSHVS